MEHFQQKWSLFRGRFVHFRAVTSEKCFITTKIPNLKTPKKANILPQQKWEFQLVNNVYSCILKFRIPLKKRGGFLKSSKQNHMIHPKKSKECESMKLKLCLNSSREDVYIQYIYIYSLLGGSSHERQVGSPLFISHEVWPFGSGITLGDLGSPWLLTTYKSWDDPPSKHLVSEFFFRTFCIFHLFTCLSSHISWGEFCVFFGICWGSRCKKTLSFGGTMLDINPHLRWRFLEILEPISMVMSARCWWRQANVLNWGVKPNNIYIYGCFLKWWYLQIIHFNRVFHYTPSILGYHYFWKHPYVYIFIYELHLRKYRT